MENGAFSDDGVVEASKKIVPVLVDCDWGKKNTDLSDKYNVEGYPTVIFTDSEGKEVEKLRGRSASAVKDQILAVGKKYTKGVVFVDYDEAFEIAKEQKKPILVFFTDGKSKSKRQEQAFIDPLVADHLKKFVLVRHEVDRKCETCKEHRITRGPMIRYLDSGLEDPVRKPLYRNSSLRIGKAWAKQLLMVLKRFLRAQKKR